MNRLLLVKNYLLILNETRLWHELTNIYAHVKQFDYMKKKCPCKFCYLSTMERFKWKFTSLVHSEFTTSTFH